MRGFSEIRLQLAAALLVLALPACAEPTSALSEQIRRAGVIYVDAQGGSDTGGDGRSPAGAYRTIGRALRDLPNVVDTAFTIQLAAGHYAEAVQLTRFAMPDAITFVQLRGGAFPYIRIRGSTENPGSVTLSPPQPEQSCISAAGVILLLEGLTCQGRRTESIVAAGSSVVVDDLRLIAADTTPSAIYLERASLFLGGNVEIRGPFVYGLSVRTNSVARSGTRLHPRSLRLSFEGVGTGIFLRDGGVFTSAFGADTLRFANVGRLIYARGLSDFFLSATGILLGEDVGEGFWANFQSSINVNRLHLRRVRGPLVRCYIQSSVQLERALYEEVGEISETDGSCSIRI